MPRNQDNSDSSQMKPKRKHRGHGEGTIYQRQDGRWAASITLENGKRKSFYGKTRKEVAEKLQRALQEQKQGVLVTEPSVKVKDYLSQWLEEVHKPSIRLNTYARQRILVYKHIIPELGHTQVQRLTPQQVQSLYTHKLEEGQSPGTIQMLHSVLHSALENAVRWGITSRNVCDFVSPPRLSTHEVQTLTLEQARKLLDTARGHRLEALLTVAITTGMREGELLALKWQDIDLVNKSLQVRRTVSFLARHGYKETEPKTAKGKRKIALSLGVVDVLKQHRIHQAEVRLKAGDIWQPLDLVFCNAHGYYLNTNNLRHQLQKLLSEAGLPSMRFHDLRHSAATIMLGMGTHPKVVQEILGHNDISVTMNVYSHVLPSMQQDTMDRWDKLL